MKMPSSSPLYGVEPRPPAMDSPKPPVVRSTTTSICFTSTTTDGPDSDKIIPLLGRGGSVLSFGARAFWVKFGSVPRCRSLQAPPPHQMVWCVLPVQATRPFLFLLTVIGVCGLYALNGEPNTLLILHQSLSPKELYHPTSLPAEALAVVLPGLTLPGQAAWDWQVGRLAGDALLPYPGGRHVTNLI
ncbi:hypothetical protein E2C01_046536 [Portunus trituberculatus]|uniref:Uncharacterized protein n=1 Tax=Portunus trituberculatus TaxID=210409 RepID=A0A5B7FY61_PORTR|nr:hypothetical protein [Portunus trituberculatus]